MHVQLNWDEIAPSLTIVFGICLMVIVVVWLVNKMLGGRRRRERNSWLAVAVEHMEQMLRSREHRLATDDTREVVAILKDHLAYCTRNLDERDALLYRALNELEAGGRRRYHERAEYLEDAEPARHRWFPRFRGERPA